MERGCTTERSSMDMLSAPRPLGISSWSSPRASHAVVGVQMTESSPAAAQRSEGMQGQHGGGGRSGPPGS
jgi:hypothetical protein